MLSFWIKLILLLCYAYVNYGKNLLESELVPVTMIENKAYYIGHHQKMNFNYANFFCEMLGMHLVSIPTKNTNDILGKMLKNQGKFWTSGNKWIGHNYWLWLGAGKPFTFTRWATEYPISTNDYPENRCIGVKSESSNLFWYNEHCFRQQIGVLCESLDGDNQKISFASKYREIAQNVPLFSYNQSSYFIGNIESMKFFGADIFCKRLGMKLVNIETPQENTFLYKILRDVGSSSYQTYWTGGFKVMPNSDWYWHQNGKKAVYTNWDSGQPDVVTEYCLRIKFYPDIGLFWHDYPCEYTAYFVCETPTENIAICPNSDFDNYKKSVNVRLKSASPVSNYHIGKEYVTHAQAVKKCKGLGLKLVSIQNIEKQEVISGFIENSCFSSDSFWTSGHRSTDKQWIWSSGEVITEFFWKQEPTVITKIEECLSIMGIEGVYYWYSEPCSYEYYYICERKK